MPTDPLVTFESSAEAMRKFAASKWYVSMNMATNMATAIWITTEANNTAAPLRRCECCKCTSPATSRYADKSSPPESDVSLKTKRQINADTAASIARLEVQPEHD
jgi:hypothetical protein